MDVVYKTRLLIQLICVLCNCVVLMLWSFGLHAGCRSLVYWWYYRAIESKGKIALAVSLILISIYSVISHAYSIWIVATVCKHIDNLSKFRKTLKFRCICVSLQIIFSMTLLVIILSFYHHVNNHKNYGNLHLFTGHRHSQALMTGNISEENDPFIDNSGGMSNESRGDNLSVVIPKINQGLNQRNKFFSFGIKISLKCCAKFNQSDLNVEPHSHQKISFIHCNDHTLTCSAMISKLINNSWVLAIGICLHLVCVGASAVFYVSTIWIQRSSMNRRKVV
ncbi:hypothetical protein GJ496_009807 [Pomphorhynchus laevis]|nr:hypothetical protein GJ496_009807 [Pomphorhynchus laevis]